MTVQKLKLSVPSIGPEVADMREFPKIATDATWQAAVINGRDHLGFQMVQIINASEEQIQWFLNEFAPSQGLLHPQRNTEVQNMAGGYIPTIH